MARVLVAFKTAGSTMLPLQKMDSLVSNYLQYRKKHFSVLKILFGNAVLFKALITGLVLLLGTSLVISRQITLGQFVASEIIIVLVVGSVEKLLSTADVIFDLLTALDKIGHITDIPLERRSGIKVNFHTLSDKGLEVDMKNLSFKYPDGGRHVLRNINLNFQPNEKVCLTGTNGSGKSTLVRLLSSYYTDFEGAFTLNKLSVRDLELNSIRDAIERNLIEDHIFDGTLLENIMMGRSAVQISDVYWAIDKLNMSDSINAFPEGLKTMMITGGKRFSESFLAKISVARCVVERPKLLLISDIYQQMDRSERLNLVAFLCDKSTPWTLVTVSHDPVVMAGCDRVIVLNEGQVVMEGPYETLVKDPRFQELAE
jgi:ABC-type bacteriocin/lantibiotic exporter with double-glycine peptidase domain